MLYNEGKLSGEKYKYPVKINDIEIKTQDELMELVGNKFEEKAELMKGMKSKPTAAKILDSTLWDLGITDSINLTDDRTTDILLKYEFLQNSTHSINNQVWFDSVIILNRLKPRMF